MQDAPKKLARKLTTFDATLIVMGGMVGSGIFLTPALIAQAARTGPLIVGVWIAGGVIAVIGGFIFAELAWRRPAVAGVYGYLRDGLSPAVAFTSGWTALLVSYSGAMAAAAVTFAAYVYPAAGVQKALAIGVLLLLTFINCLGVRPGSLAQNVLMVLKIGAIAAIVLAGVFGTPGAAATQMLPPATSWLVIIGAIVPVLFAYDGWQTAPFIDEEMRDPRRGMPRAMLFGVFAVMILYIAVTLAGLRILGPAGLAHSSAPAADMMHNLWGLAGVRIVAAAVAISTLGYLSNAILVSPRLYYAMAEDGLFFKQLAWVHPKTQTPVVAIAVQGIVAAIITLFNGFSQILALVVSIDFIYFALVAYTLFVFRRRDPGAAGGVRVPGHPVTTIFFIAVSAAVVVQLIVTQPLQTLGGIAILFSGIVVYYVRRAYLQRKEAPV